MNDKIVMICIVLSSTSILPMLTIIACAIELSIRPSSINNNFEYLYGVGPRGSPELARYFIRRVIVSLFFFMLLNAPSILLLINNHKGQVP